MVKNYMELEVADEFNKIICSSDKLVVVDFYAEWCMPCLMLSPILEDLAEQMKNVNFIRVNTEDNEELAARFKISNIPCLIIFKNGKEAGRIIGSHSSDVIEEKIKKIMNEN
jgi:thioredoxin 1